MIKWLKTILITSILICFLGCGAAWKEAMQHDSMYADGDHLLFSIGWYQYPTKEDVKKSKENKWWGETIYFQ